MGVCTIAPVDSVPIAVGFGFLLTGVFIILQNRLMIEPIFFIWSAGVLFTGLLSGSLTPVELTLFSIYLAFDGPIIFHFNMVLLDRKLRTIESFSLKLLYLFAFILSISIIVVLFTIPFPNLIYTYLKSISRIFFVISFIWTFYLLWEGYNRFSSLPARRRIRLMVYGTVLAVMPLLFLTALPQALGIRFFLPALTFTPLLMIPVLYLYATFRARLGYAENTFRSLMAYFMLGIIYVTLFLFTSQLQEYLPLAGKDFYILLITTFIALIAFLPLRRALFWGVDWVFYGNETDYHTALNYLEGLFASVLNREGIIYLIMDELISAIKPTHAVLFLRQLDSNLVYSGSQRLFENPFVNLRIHYESPLALYLAKSSRPESVQDLKLKILPEKLTVDEKVLLSAAEIALWIPLVSEDVLQGLVLLSLRSGDDLYTEKDKNLLSNIIPKAGAAMRNIILSEEILAGKEELAQAHYRLITSQEEERKRIARDLHDDTIQKLLGISYQVADVKNRFASLLNDDSPDTRKQFQDLEGVRGHIADTISGIRRMINELRPPGLDEFGIRVTLENMVQQYRQNGGVAGRIEFSMDIDPEVDKLPDTQAICIYRISQEAIRNIIKHAEASRINITLSFGAEQVFMVIEDNGKGFFVPDRLSELAQSNHFGLIGISERARSIGGMVDVTSEIDKGTQINVSLPVKEKG